MSGTKYTNLIFDCLQYFVAREVVNNEADFIVCV